MKVETGSTNNFPVVTDTDIVPKPKLGHKASRVYTTSSDSGRYYSLPNIQDGGQWPEVVTT